MRRAADGLVDGSTLPSVLVERTQNPEHGDYSITLPLKLARSLRQPPIRIAEGLAGRLILPPGFAEVSVAPPGFINLRLQRGWLAAQLSPIVEAGPAWGRSALGGGTSVQVEFVSSNPTGPLLFSHARGAVVGDVVARVLEASGFEVQREYYVNDYGKQIRLFGESILARMQGRPAPEGGYGGDYITQIAEAARESGLPADQTLLANSGIDWVKVQIDRDLKQLGVHHDKWFYENTLYQGIDKETLEELRRRGRIIEKDGAVWFKSDTGKDEVLIRRDGYPTYFASDIFYHRNKLETRRFARVVDVWGADHQGQIGRLKEALEALDLDASRLHVLLVQLVSVKRGEEAVRMSRRAGVGITLKEMLDEVGPDAVRYFFLQRSADAHMQFDVDLAKQHSAENPVFYAQYAHARLANVLSFGGAVEAPPALDRLATEWELELMRVMVRWPDVVGEAAEALEPHRLAFYTDELAADIHRFYKNCRIVTEDRPLTAARLQLSRAARTTIANALALMGVSAPDRM